MNDRVDPQVADHLRRTLRAVADTTPRPIAVARSTAAGRAGRERTFARVAAVALVLAGVGGIVAVAQRQGEAPATSVPPAPTETSRVPIDSSVMPEGDQCELSAQAERVAVAANPYGGAGYEWWAAPTVGGGRADNIVQVDADGQVIGGLGGGSACTPTPTVDIEFSVGQASPVLPRSSCKAAR